MVCIVPHFIIILYNNHTYIRIQAWSCMPQIEFGRFQIFQQIYQFEGTVEY